MAEISLTARPPLGGADIAIGRNRIRERTDLALVSVATPIDGEEALAAALMSAFSLEMPAPTQTSTGNNDDMRAIWTAPDQMLLMFPSDADDPAADVGAALKGAGYVTDQTGGWVLLQLSGADVFAALERLCPVDLSAPGCAEGASARTVMEHMGVQIVRLGPERVLLMSASSSARSFLHAVETAVSSVT